MSAETTKSDQGMRRIAAFTTAALLGLFAGLGLLLFVTVTRHQQALPPLTSAEYEAAKRRWDAHGPTSYIVEVVVTGRQAARYSVEVRDGAVIAATRDGEALTQQRTMGTWSVPGMFETIGSDVRSAQRHEQGTADEQTPQVLLRGVFDDHDGHPLRYHRTELRKWGPNVEVMWEVTRFGVGEP